MNNELTHWGILGMKWGVRRYQNEDGTLTEAGRKRYGDNYKPDGQKKLSKSDISKMSDDELNQRINRIQKENQLAGLMGINEKTTHKGRDFVARTLTGAGERAASKLAEQAMIYAGKQIVKEILGTSAYKEMFNIKDSEVKSALDKAKGYKLDVKRADNAGKAAEANKQKAEADKAKAKLDSEKEKNAEKHYKEAMKYSKNLTDEEKLKLYRDRYGK